jgi:hypothetical protein
LDIEAPKLTNPHKWLFRTGCGCKYLQTVKAIWTLSFPSLLYLSMYSRKEEREKIWVKDLEDQVEQVKKQTYELKEVCI